METGNIISRRHYLETKKYLKENGIENPTDQEIKECYFSSIASMRAFHDFEKIMETISLGDLDDE